MSSTLILNYANNTKNICLCLAISMFLIILFMMTPLNSFLLTSFLGKTIILVLLGYIIYNNTYYTNKFSNDFNISLTTGKWNQGKTNVFCGHLFSIFTLLLFISVLRQLF